MSEDDLIQAVRSAVVDHVMSSPATRVRDPYAIDKLAQTIVKRITANNSIWQKWDPAREKVLSSASNCWIPVEDLRDHLNQLPGPVLTLTDVKQRLRAMQEEDYVSTPDEEMRAACLAIIGAEKAQGTELPAIIGAVQEHLTDDWLRRYNAEREARERRREEERIALEQRFLSGADCRWTSVNGSTDVYCRVNARTYQLSRGADKTWKLQRVISVDDPNRSLVGTYKVRGDATKVVSEVAYRPE